MHKDDHEEGESALCLCCLTRLCAYVELTGGEILDLQKVADQAIKLARLKTVEDRNDAVFAAVQAVRMICQLGLEDAMADALNLGLPERLEPVLRARLEKAQDDTGALRAA